MHDGLREVAIDYFTNDGEEEENKDSETDLEIDGGKTA